MKCHKWCAHTHTWKSLALTGIWFSFCYPHLTVDPVQEIGDVAINAWFVQLSAVFPPNTVPYEPPYSILQGHQRAAAVGLRKSSAQNWSDFFKTYTLWKRHATEGLYNDLNVSFFLMLFDGLSRIYKLHEKHYKTWYHGQLPPQCSNLTLIVGSTV